MLAYQPSLSPLPCTLGYFWLQPASCVQNHTGRMPCLVFQTPCTSSAKRVSRWAVRTMQGMSGAGAVSHTHDPCLGYTANSPAGQVQAEFAA